MKLRRVTFPKLLVFLILLSWAGAAQAADRGRADAGQEEGGLLAGVWRAALVAMLPNLDGTATQAAVPEEPKRAMPDEVDDGDPLEPINRWTEAFNELVDAHVLDPAYQFYVHRVPLAVQRGVSNVFRNLHEPITAVSAALEGDMENATVASLRFGINSTAGVLGTMDVASGLNLVSRRTDLAATFCRYGIPSGPYLVLPILGPSSPREVVGRVLTNLTIYNFIGGAFYPYYSGKLLSEYVDDRPALDGMLDGAVDSYALRRSIFRQREAALCREEPNAVPDNGSDAEPPHGVVAASAAAQGR